MNPPSDRSATPDAVTRTLGMLDGLLKEWDEAKHPRGEGGRFASASSGGEVIVGWERVRQIWKAMRDRERAEFDGITKRSEWAWAADQTKITYPNRTSIEAVILASKMTTPVADILNTPGSSFGEAVRATFTPDRFAPDSKDLPQKIEDLTPEQEAMVKARAAQMIIDGWFGDSGDQSHAWIQDAARSEFRLEGAAPAYSREQGDTAQFGSSRTLQYYGEPPQGLTQDLLRAQYDTTQDQFRAAGVGPDDSIRLYRAATAKNAGFSRGDQPGEEGVASLRPMTSWTPKQDSAEEYRRTAAYAYGNRGMMVYSADIPISRIASTSTSGMGDSFTEEHIVLGTQQPVTAEMPVKKESDKAIGILDNLIKDWDPAKHPRESDGKFGSGGSAGAPPAPTNYFDINRSKPTGEQTSDWRSLPFRVGDSNFKPDPSDHLSIALKEWFIGGPTEGKVSQANLDVLEKEIQTNGKPVSQELFRGIGVNDLTGMSWKGDTINLSPSSFSEAGWIAEQFSENGEIPVIFHVPPGTITLDVSDRSPWTEQEHLVAGQFKVEKTMRGEYIDASGNDWANENILHVYLKAA